MGLEISKRYSCYSFHPMLLKLYEDIGYHGRIQAVTFLFNRPNLKKNVALWNFNMRVNGKIMKCAISWKWLTVERNGWKFGTRGPRNSLCRVLFGSGHLRSVWGHSVHFAKYPMLKFSKGYCCPSFHPVWTKLYWKHGNPGRIQAITIMAICQILKVYGTLKISYLSYIASIHKSMLVSSDKWSSRSSRPLGLLLWYAWKQRFEVHRPLHFVDLSVKKYWSWFLKTCSKC